MIVSAAPTTATVALLLLMSLGVEAQQAPGAQANHTQPPHSDSTATEPPSTSFLSTSTSLAVLGGFTLLFGLLLVGVLVCCKKRSELADDDMSWGELSSSSTGSFESYVRRNERLQV